MVEILQLPGYQHEKVNKKCNLLIVVKICKYFKV